MKSQGKQTDTSILIAGLTPEFLEKPALWWKKHTKELIKKRIINPYVRRNTIVIEKDAACKQSELLRALSEIGYQKTLFALAKGTYIHKGAAIIVFPLNYDSPIAIEFSGNTIVSIGTHTAISREEGIISPAKKKVRNFHAGDYVVHIDHGIGIFREENNGHAVVAYARARKNGPPDLLFVPIEDKKRLSLYMGLRTPTVHRLGTPMWRATKKKAKEDIVAFARTLASLYKKRACIARAPYHEYPIEKEIWDIFPFEETHDQKKACKEIFEDLAKKSPMERLLAGDVGFGKTEVALRTALRVLLNKKQAALLAPTTVLADQHASLFAARLRPLGIQTARLTRLEKQQEAKRIKEKIGKGDIGMVVGTHTLLHASVQFRNLGLLIIDEEQRFGVRQKEKMKEAYPNVDILSLSATPIPRTLAFSIAGVRAFSQLKEAPRGRRAPLSHVLPHSEKVIKEALIQEHKRNGQVYYLANRIRHIPRILEKLKTIAPHMRAEVIHGRLSEQKIIEVMRNFRKKNIDILVSTTIIENGLDIQNVNTLIVEDASLLGLSQAHQLRGRIGRSDIQSYAYFFYPLRILDRKKEITEPRMTKNAERRLAILEELSHLGAGIEIAHRDLEIRGAGNILGKEQSGVANKIGWNLYFEMLNEALEEIKET